MKRVLLLTDDMCQGGAERQLTYLAVEFKRKGYDVRLIKFYPGHNYYESDLSDCGLKTELDLTGRIAWKRPFAIARLIKEWSPDLVVTYKDGTSMAACLAKVLTRFNLAVSERNTTQRLTTKERLKFNLYRLANHVVPNSYSQADFIKTNASWLGSKVSVITNMIDVDKFCISPHKPQNTKPHIITTARIAPQKNIINYLHAIASLKQMNVDAHFDWFGRPEHEDYFELVKQEVSKLGIADMITFHGASENVAEEYHKADFFCLPSIYEGFPNVLCEAMASGLPSIASDVCDNPCILENPLRRFDPTSEKNIVDTILNLLNMSEELRRFEGINNRSKIVEMCSPESFINKYISLIK